MDDPGPYGDHLGAWGECSSGPGGVGVFQFILFVQYNIFFRTIHRSTAIGRMHGQSPRSRNGRVHDATAAKLPQMQCPKKPAYGRRSQVFWARKLCWSTVATACSLRTRCTPWVVSCATFSECSSSASRDAQVNSRSSATASRRKKGSVRPGGKPSVSSFG